MNTSTLRIWDLPTRLFHWGLAISIAGSIISIKTGHTDWHFRFGYLILTLLLFRLVWGFAGPRYARFSSFPPSLAAAWAYVRGRAAPTPGHSPLAAWSVYALLASCTFQVVSGLFSARQRRGEASRARDFSCFRCGGRLADSLSAPRA